jgi:hypothetical protein
MDGNPAGSHPHFWEEGCGSPEGCARHTGTSRPHHLMRDLESHRIQAGIEDGEPANLSAGAGCAHKRYQPFIDRTLSMFILACA